jgi:hypothetical protein
MLDFNQFEVVSFDQEFQRWYPPRDLSVESIQNRKSSSPRIYPWGQSKI